MPAGRLVALLALASLLAGCAAPGEAPAAAPPIQPEATSSAAYEIAASLPPEEVANATLGDDHVHDAWGEATELVLFDGAVEAGLCEGPFDAALYAFLQALGDQEAVYGCARLSLDEGKVVPEGTGFLRVEADASGALKGGGYKLQWRNKAREQDEEPSTAPQHAWRVALTETDWDIAHANATTFVMYLVATGPVGAFEGPVQARIVAERQEGWEPILAVAHVDHWKLPTLHEFPAPGVMLLLDGHANVTNVDPMRFLGGNAPEPVLLADLVPPGAAWITIVSDRTSADCAPALDCWLVPLLQVGGYERQRAGELILREGERSAYAWRVPDDVPFDSVYANASTTGIDPRIDACAAGQEATCGFASLASGSVGARLLALAWKGDVDLETLKRIAG